MAFKVTWPPVLLDYISGIKNVVSVIKLDLLKFPGFSCLWAGFAYYTQFWFKMVEL